MGQPYAVQQQAIAVFFGTALADPVSLLVQLGITLNQFTALMGYLEYLQTVVAIPMFTQMTILSNNGLVVVRLRAYERGTSRER